MSLTRKMADFGFETTVDYSLPVRMLLERPTETVRTLNVTGEAGRRKTAFANALAAALDFPQILYHDFAHTESPAAEPAESEHPPIDPFDRVMSEACAFSEAERTVVILDQLQQTAFAEHLRLYDFLKSQQWHYLDVSATANLNNLVLFLVSEEPVYHSLQKLSLRVWVDATGAGRPPYAPADFGRDLRIGQTMERLGDLFEVLGVIPTRSEYERILYDIEHLVRTPEALIQSIFGWVEGVEYALFRAPAVVDAVQATIEALYDYLGVESLDV